eukprot:2658006-Rhodomonas_salina.2
MQAWHLAFARYAMSGSDRVWGYTREAALARKEEMLQTIRQLILVAPLPKRPRFYFALCGTDV